MRRQIPKEKHTYGQDSDADELPRADPAAEVILTRRVISPEQLDKRPDDRVAHQVGSKNVPVEFLAAIQPGQRQVEPKVEQRFVDLRGMHMSRVSGVSGRKLDGPGEIGHPAIATAVHQTTDPAEGMAQSDAWSQRVGHFPDRLLLNAEIDIGCYDRPDQSAIEDQTAAAKVENVPPRLSREILLPIRDDVERPGTHHDPTHQPGSQIGDDDRRYLVEYAPPGGGPDSCYNTQSEQDSVPMNGKAVDFECDWMHWATKLVADLSKIKRQTYAGWVSYCINVIMQYIPVGFAFLLYYYSNTVRLFATMPLDHATHLSVRIDWKSHTPTYAQIVGKVNCIILSNQLKQGDLLPQIRKLAAQLDVNPNTVARAYDELEALGLIRKRQGSGCYVTGNRNRGTTKAARIQPLVDRLDELVADARLLGVSMSELIEELKRHDLPADASSENTPRIAGASEIKPRPANIEDSAAPANLWQAADTLID